jgi:hypothetical protein
MAPTLSKPFLTPRAVGAKSGVLGMNLDFEILDEPRLSTLYDEYLLDYPTYIY